MNTRKLAFQSILSKNILAPGDFNQLPKGDKNKIFSLLAPHPKEALSMIRQGVFLDEYPEIKSFVKQQWHWELFADQIGTEILEKEYSSEAEAIAKNGHTRFNVLVDAVNPALAGSFVTSTKGDYIELTLELKQWGVGDRYFWRYEIV